MSDFYDTQYTLDVNEDLVSDETGTCYTLDDDVDMLMEYPDVSVGEELLEPTEESFVVEDDAFDGAVDNTIPGSTSQYVEDAPEEEKPKDWANDKDPGSFLDYAKDKLTKIPKHSGETVHGCERAKSYIKSLLAELSKAMRSDYDSKIDEAEAEQLSQYCNDGIDRLNKQIKKLTGKKANLNVKLVSDGHCDKCDSHAPMWQDIENDRLVCMSCENTEAGDKMVKEANTPVLNVYVSAFERAIVGTLINSTVSGGRNIEETYDKLKKKYAFTDREELAIQQLVADHGYPIIKDRGLIGEKEDQATGNTVDFQTNYQA